MHINSIAVFDELPQIVIFITFLKRYTMGLLTPKGKKGDKKGSSNIPKNGGQNSKFINKGVKSVAKKQMPGSAQRGS